jgi:hypothetical protein
VPVTGEGIEPTAISYRATAEQIEAYGAGTGQGLRITIVDDEDDGGSTWDDVAVERLG